MADFDRLVSEYAEVIRAWDWRAIVVSARANVEVDSFGQREGRDFLGTCFSLLPSQRYASGEEADEAWWEALEKVAEEHGGSAVCGEDPCDIYFSIVIDEE